MRNTQTSTATIDALPDGLGATLDHAIENRPDMTRLRLCGELPNPGKARAEWVHNLGHWVPQGTGHVAGEFVRLKVQHRGRTVDVTAAAPWFGSSPAAAVDEAAACLAYFVGTAGKGARMQPSPGATGRSMLAAQWTKARVHGDVYPIEQDEDVQRFIREGMGQGRFELLRPNTPVAGLEAVDARFAYAAFCSHEMPIGLPEWITTEPGEYEQAVGRVKFTPPAWESIGVLGVKDPSGVGWRYPTTGTHETVCTWLEVFTARRHGYQVQWMGGYRWTKVGKPLAGWARRIAEERQNVDRRSRRPEVQEAIRTGLRAMLVQTIGQLHGAPRRNTMIVHPGGDYPTDTVAVRPLDDGTELVTYNAPHAVQYTGAHPEWTSAVFAWGRTRLVEHMKRQTAPVVACAADAFYVDGDAVVAPDTGAAGAWRLAGRYGPADGWPTLTGLYEHTKGAS